MEWILCWVVESSCLLIHNIASHISWHVLPHDRTTKKYTDFPNMVIFQLLLQKFWIRTWCCNYQKYIFVYFILSLSTSQIYMIKEDFIALPNQLLYWVLSTSEQCFVSFQSIWCHSHTQIRTTLRTFFSAFRTSKSVDTIDHRSTNNFPHFDFVVDVWLPQLIGTDVWLPKMHNVPFDVDFGFSRSLQKSESSNNQRLHCCIVFPTKQYCRNSLV